MGHAARCWAPGGGRLCSWMKAVDPDPGRSPAPTPLDPLHSDEFGRQSLPPELQHRDAFVWHGHTRFGVHAE